MADEKSEGAPETPPQVELNFTGMDKITSVYADAFMLAHKEDAVSLYFFQIGLPASKSGVLGETSQLHAQEAQCVARIIMSPLGFSKLLQGMAQNFDATITKGEEEK